MSEHQQTELLNVGPALATLERRARYLANQLTDWKGSPTGREFAEAEHEAIEVGIGALKLHRAKLEGMAEPIAALRELVRAIGEIADNDKNMTVRTALKRARLALEEFGALEEEPS